MSIGTDHIKALFLKAAAPAQDPAAEAMAAAAKQVPSAMPVPTLAKSQQEQATDPAADQAKIEEAHRKELERKDKELNTLRNTNEVMQVQMAHLKALAQLDKHREQVYKNIEKKEQDHRREMEKEDIALQQKKERMAAEEIKHQAKMDVASAHQQAQAAEAQAKATAQQAQQNAQQYVKMTEDVRKNSDNYFAQRSKELDKRKMDLDAQQKKLDAEGSRISPIVMNRLNSAVKATQGLGSIREKLQGTPGISASSTVDALNKMAFAGPGAYITAAQNQYKKQRRAEAAATEKQRRDKLNAPLVIPADIMKYYDAVSDAAKLDSDMAMYQRQLDALTREKEKLAGAPTTPETQREMIRLESEIAEAKKAMQLEQYALALVQRDLVEDGEEGLSPLGVPSGVYRKMYDSDVALKRQEAEAFDPQKMLDAKARVRAAEIEAARMHAIDRDSIKKLLTTRLNNDIIELSRAGLAPDPEALQAYRNSIDSRVDDIYKAIKLEQAQLKNYTNNNSIGALGTGESPRATLQSMRNDASSYLAHALTGNGDLYTEVYAPGNFPAAVANSIVSGIPNAALTGVNNARAVDQANRIINSQGEQSGFLSSEGLSDATRGALLSQGLPETDLGVGARVGGDIALGAAVPGMFRLGKNAIKGAIGAGKAAQGGAVTGAGQAAGRAGTSALSKLKGVGKAVGASGGWIAAGMLSSHPASPVLDRSGQITALHANLPAWDALPKATNVGEFMAAMRKSRAGAQPAGEAPSMNKGANVQVPSQAGMNQQTQQQIAGMYSPRKTMQLPQGYQQPQAPAVQSPYVTVRKVPNTPTDSHIGYDGLNIGSKHRAAAESNSWIRSMMPYVAPAAAMFGINLLEPGATRTYGTPINFARAVQNAPRDIVHTLASRNRWNTTPEGAALQASLQQQARGTTPWTFSNQWGGADNV